MTYKNPDIPQISSPVLLDKAIQEVQAKLATMSWLEKAFGRAYKSVEDRDGRAFYSPEIYLGDGEYLSMLPNDNFDSYCFFVPQDPQVLSDYSPNSGAFAVIRARVDIVFYFNLERIDSSKNYRFGEELKKDILDVLSRELIGTYAQVEVMNIYEEIESVFRGYTIDAKNTQLFKHPWQGLRFECEFSFREQC